MNIGKYNHILGAIDANRWLKAVVILAIFLFLAELITFLAEKILLKLTKRTKTTLDDEMVRRLKNPVSMLMFFIGLRLSIMALELSGNSESISRGLLNSIIGISVVYIVTASLKTIFAYWKKNRSRRLKIPVNDSFLILTNKSLTVLFFIISFIVVLKVWGVEIGPLLTGLGIGGVAIAFATQKTLGNVIGGIAVILDKSVNVNDIVVLEDGKMGKITDIGLRSTQVRTYDDEVVIVPNGKLESMNIQNVAKPELAVRVVIPFSVAYGSEVKDVKDAVIKEIRKIKGVVLGDDEKKPAVRFLEMKDSCLHFKAFFWIEDCNNRFDAIDEGTTRVYDILNKKKIHIPFPQMDVHMKKR